MTPEQPMQVIVNHKGQIGLLFRDAGGNEVVLSMTKTEALKVAEMLTTAARKVA